MYIITREISEHVSFGIFSEHWHWVFLILINSLHRSLLLPDVTLQKYDLNPAAEVEGVTSVRWV